MLLGGYGLVDAVERLLGAFGALFAPQCLALPVGQVEHVVGDVAVGGQDVRAHELDGRVRGCGAAWRGRVAPLAGHRRGLPVAGDAGGGGDDAFPCGPEAALAAFRVQAQLLDLSLIHI